MADSVLRQLPEARAKFAAYFEGLRFDDCLDAGLSVAVMGPKIDLGRFERYLHEAHGGYEKDGLGLEEFLRIEHGSDTAAFIMELLI
jgi:hypothetical protein